MVELKCRVEAIRKGSDGLVRVFISYPGALNEAEFVFKLLPSELGVDWFVGTTREVMDKMRGAP